MVQGKRELTKGKTLVKHYKWAAIHFENRTIIPSDVPTFSADQLEHLMNTKVLKVVAEGRKIHLYV